MLIAQLGDAGIAERKGLPADGLHAQRRADDGAVTDQPVIVCNGFASREAFKIADRPAHFYMIGSMGVAPAIGLMFLLGLWPQVILGWVNTTVVQLAAAVTR